MLSSARINFYLQKRKINVPFYFSAATFLPGSANIAIFIENSASPFAYIRASVYKQVSSRVYI